MNLSNKTLFVSASIISVITVVSGVLLLNANNNNSKDLYLGLDEVNSTLEVIEPMSCTYKGKLKLDNLTQSSLKKYQKILN